MFFQIPQLIYFNMIYYFIANYYKSALVQLAAHWPSVEFPCDLQRQRLCSYLHRWIRSKIRMFYQFIMVLVNDKIDYSHCQGATGIFFRIYDALTDRCCLAKWSLKSNMMYKSTVLSLETRFYCLLLLGVWTRALEITKH